MRFDIVTIIAKLTEFWYRLAFVRTSITPGSSAGCAGLVMSGVCLGTVVAVSTCRVRRDVLVNVENVSVVSEIWEDEIG